MRIADHLYALGNIWAAASGRSLARLGNIVVNDGKFFQLLARPDANITVRTFERYLAFFRDGANWPDHKIPLAAAELLDRLDNIAHDSASRGQVGDMSHPQADAACSSGLSHPQADAA